MTTRPSISQLGALLVGVVLTLVLAMTSSERDAASMQATATPTSARLIYDSAFGSEDEDLAAYGTIFVGEILGVTRTREVATSDPKFSIPVVYYLVDVERVLNGDVADKVEIKVDGLDTGSEYEPLQDSLAVGGRHLIFTGSPLPDGSYSVTLGLGTIPIENDQQEVELIARFERLIPQAERSNERALVQAEAGGERLPPGLPRVSLEPNEGPVRSEFVISGNNFLPGQILITWDVEGHGEVAIAGENFAFEESLTVPRKLEPGLHTITVQDGYAPPVEVEFVVTG